MDKMAKLVWYTSAANFCSLVSDLSLLHSFLYEGALADGYQDRSGSGLCHGC